MTALAAILQAADADARSDRAISLAATGEESALAAIRRGRVPSVERARALCEVLGLEFYVGLPRVDGPPIAAEDDPPEWAGALRDEIVSAKEEVRAASAEMKSVLQRFAEAGDPEAERQYLDWFAAQHDEDADVFDTEEAPGTQRVNVVELSAAAGAGAEVLDEEVVGGVWFSRGWLRRRGLDATRCVMVRVRGESMEPALHDGASVLVDCNHRRRRKDRIFVVRLPDDGVVVKRAGRDEDGGWTMLSEHPSWEPVPWPKDAVTIGQVVWTARSLI